MKKIISIFFAMFIIFAMTLPAFAATECEHVVNYPATPAYTHEVGLDIYLCDLCGYEMWHCEVCDQYMPIHEVSCKNCEELRIALNSVEQNQINTIEEDKDFSTGVSIFIIMMFIGLLSIIVFGNHNFH